MNRIVGNSQENNVVRKVPNKYLTPNINDMKRLIEASKEFGKMIDIDDFMKLFRKNLRKTEKSVSDIESLERFTSAFIYLRNLGLFSKTKRTKKLWKKTYFGKSSYRRK